jgi:hypothetical protein
LTAARAVAGAFIDGTIGDIGGFQAELKRLAKDAHFSTRNRETPEGAPDAGHAGVLRARNPSPDELRPALDIVEDLP